MNILRILVCGLFSISADASGKGSVPNLRDDSGSKPVYRPSPQQLLDRELADFAAVTSREERERLQRLLREGLAANERAREEERRRAVVDRVFVISADALSKGSVVASTAPDELDRLQRLLREGLAAKERAREEARRRAIVDRVHAH